MMKHSHTEPSVINFSKLEYRIMAINNTEMGKFNNIRKMLCELNAQGGPTLIMATGGSKVVAYYLQLVIERLGLSSIVEVIEPRDYFYKGNVDSFSNLIVISASGKTNGIEDAFAHFQGNKYLVCENEKSGDYEAVSWGNELYDKEKSFISLATSLGPITLLLDSTESLNSELSSSEISKINDRVKELFERSAEKIDKLDVNFKDTSLVQIMSGYDTKTSSSVLESNLVEGGLAAAVVHDKGSYCHGRSNLLFQNPVSPMIYLAHNMSRLDNEMFDVLKSEYPNIFSFNSFDEDDEFWKDFYLALQMYYLSKKIAEDKNIDITMPEYNPQVVKKLYKYRGEM